MCEKIIWNDKRVKSNPQFPKYFYITSTETFKIDSNLWEKMIEIFLQY